MMLVAKFLKRATPFANLDAERLRWLAARLEHREVPAGTTIIRQGEPGETCYLLRSGHVEVLLEAEDAPEHSLDTLGPGTVFGEAALLTQAPRNATVRATEPCTLLVLHRADLLEVLAADPQARGYFLDLVQLRRRARQVPGILAYHGTLR